MTSVVHGARQRFGRGGTSVQARLDGLERAVDAARGRLDDSVVDRAHEVVERAGQRLRLSGDHTVVALGGATGSGKSSLFNAMCGLDLAAVGVKRPTTSWALACAWGPDGAAELLDWLGIPKRHQVSRVGTLDPSDSDAALEGLVLLDLPDHDSTEVAHHVEVDRLVSLADLLVWVMDPQKYADAAVHDRYLKPLADHSDILLVVANHIDEVSMEQRDDYVRDVRRLVKEDGLDGVEVLPTSATRGDGLESLRKHLAARVAAKEASRQRLTADVLTVARELAEQCGDGGSVQLNRRTRKDLTDAFAEAAGVPIVVDAVRDSTRARVRLATGWPVTKWLGRWRPDPLRRLHLDTVRGGRRAATVRSSLPEPTPVQRAQVDTAVRELVEESSRSLPEVWAHAVRRASVSRLDELGDALDQAVVNTDLGVARTPLWWRGVRALQWLLFVVAVAGGLWLAALAVMGLLKLPEPSTPGVVGVPWPTLMLVGGAALGVVVALVCRLAAAVSGRRRGREAGRRLRASIGQVADSLVIEPVEAELAAYRTCREGVTAALG